MIDAKYGMKYPFPHTITHIIDNSAYNGTTTVSYADDPSLFSTLVVGAFPMGEDKTVIKLEDTKIPRVCYGLNSITQADRDKYGQVVDYPVALLEQGAPVQILRVTPDDAQYAFTTILVKYKWVDDPTNESVFHVKFETDTEAPTGSVLSNFKNPERLAQAIFNQYSKAARPSDDGWYTRAFAVIVSAGRGAVYNNMNMAINTISQSRRPTNTRYSFSTIDTRTSSVIEEFVASLVNIDNPNDIYTETVNNVVNQRTKGGSVLKPFINEKAVVEVFEQYKMHYDEMIDTGSYDNDTFVINTRKTLNVNTFDIITGKYIYGGGLDTDLPFYQVDAEDPDIPRLDSAHQLKNTLLEYAGGPGDPPNPPANPDGVLETYLMRSAYGIDSAGCSVYVGDVYLTGTGSRLTSPRLALICAINQYSQAVTNVAFDTVYPLVKYTGTPDPGIDPVNPVTVSEGGTTYKIAINIAESPVTIKKIFEHEPTLTELKAEKIEANMVYGVVSSSDSSADEFTLWYVAEITDADVTQYSYTKEQIISAIPYTSKVGMENILSVYNGTDPLPNFNKHANTTGYPIINIANGKAYINSYDILVDGTPAAFPEKRTLIVDNGLKFGNPPSTAGTTTDLIGQKFDIMTYKDEDVTKWAIVNTKTASDITTTGTWNVGERVVYNVPEDVYTVTTEQPDDWATAYTSYYTFSAVPSAAAAPTWTAKTYYSKKDDVYTVTKEKPENWDTEYTSYYTVAAVPQGEEAPTWAEHTYYSKTVNTIARVLFNVTGVDTNGNVIELTPITNNSSNSPEKLIGALTLMPYPDPGSVNRNLAVIFYETDNVPYAVKDESTPYEINRYVVTGIIGSLFKFASDGVNIPDDYYSPHYGVNLSSTFGGVPLENGSAGFLDDNTLNDIVFKYKYAALLTKAFKGDPDPRILSSVRVPAKYLFDAGYNTVIGSSFVTNASHTVTDWINGSVNFTDDEKDEILYYPDIISSLEPEDIDVKQAMYDLMIERVYDGMPEDKRPIGPGSGFQVLFDSCVSDGATAEAINRSFKTRFTNPNASWDIGGLTTPSGYTYTFVKRTVDNLFNHCKTYSINKPFTGDYTTIAPTEYVSIFPDIDANNWEYRNLMWNSGGNAWLPDANGYIRRNSQRTFYSEETSDLIWESNMRTLSQLCYLLRQKIEHYLFEYSDDSTLKTMKTECDTMFSNWIGDLVEELTINFERGLNTDGGDIVICTVKVVFRGLVIRVPIIVNVERRTS